MLYGKVNYNTYFEIYLFQILHLFWDSCVQYLLQINFHRGFFSHGCIAPVLVCAFIFVLSSYLCSNPTAYIISPFPGDICFYFPLLILLIAFDTAQEKIDFKIMELPPVKEAPDTKATLMGHA